MLFAAAVQSASPPLPRYFTHHWLIQHAFTVRTVSDFSCFFPFFSSYPSIHPSRQASKQATNVPSIRQWRRDALEAIISITFLGCHDSWLRLNFDWQYRKHLKCLFPASVIYDYSLLALCLFRLGKVILKSFVSRQMSLWLTAIASAWILVWIHHTAAKRKSSYSLYRPLTRNAPAAYHTALHNGASELNVPEFTTSLNNICVIPPNSHDPQHQLAIRSIRLRRLYTYSLSLSLSLLLFLWCVISICFDIDWINLWPKATLRSTPSRNDNLKLYIYCSPWTIWTKSEYDLSDYPFCPIWDLYFERVEFTTDRASLWVGGCHIDWNCRDKRYASLHEFLRYGR